MERNRVNITKRILLLFLVFWITFISVFNAYKTTTYCAEWVAGTMAAIAGAPITTALLIGGVVVVGGIALYELSQTTLSDHADFVRDIQSGFEGFVAEQETKIAKEQNTSLTDQEAADIGVANARETLSNFKENCLDVTRTTGRTLKTKTVEYWKRFGNVINDVADNGLSSGGLEVGDPLKVCICPDFELMSSVYASQFHATYQDYNERTTYDGVTYISEGRYYWEENSYIDVGTTIRTATSTLRHCIPFIFAIENNDYLEIRICGFNLDKINSLDYNINYGTVVLGNGYQIMMEKESGWNYIKQMIALSSLPVIFGKLNNTNIEAIYNNWRSWFNVTGGNDIIPNYKRTVNRALTDTKYGSSIRTGRRQLANEGDYVHSTFKEDSIPVKKTGVRVIDNAVTGTVGWDIPNDRVWDDVFSGGKPVGDVIGGTGVYQVPKDAVVDYPTPYDVTFPKDTLVDDVDNPPIDTPWDEPLDPDVPDPDKPIEDIIDENEGEFYPTALDWTTIFPFCIPFDIIYLVDKFNVRGEAPVITLPIVYPTAIRSVMGSDRYEVVIDFNDYVTIRNIIRVFLILLFIAGLMKVTRNLIRG